MFCVICAQLLLPCLVSLQLHIHCCPATVMFLVICAQYAMHCEMLNVVTVSIVALQKLTCSWHAWPACSLISTAALLQLCFM